MNQFIFIFFIVFQLSFNSHASNFCRNALAPSSISTQKTPSDLFKTEWKKYAYISSVWYHLLFHIPKNGIVIEIAPGAVPKIGLALARNQFSGTIFVVEPNAIALQKVILLYHELMPQAKIIGIEKTLMESLETLPSNPDALIANHPLDDMIIAESINDIENNKIFTSIYSQVEEIRSSLDQNWKTLISNDKNLQSIKNNVAKQWETAYRKVHPKTFIIGQYESGVQRVFDMNISDQSALDTLNILKNQIGASGELFRKSLLQYGENPDRWLILESSGLSQVQGVPKAIERLGKNVFITTRAEKLPLSQVKLLGVQSELVRDLFGDVNVDKFVLENFSLNISDSGSETVWVDRQADPMGIALSGNLGSGRAGYVGQDINIKGIGKTPLLKSNDGFHDTGRVTLAAGIVEMVSANTVSRNLRTGASPVLALIDTGINFQGRRAALIVRLDQGQLDRPTHLFLKEKKAAPIDLQKFATDFGRQDAERFIERILHGWWSAGNISIHGDMLDFEGITGVETRHPQTAYGAWFPDNYFGLEGRPMIKILTTLKDHVAVTKDLSKEQLKSIFKKTRDQQMSWRLLDLLGVHPYDKEKVMQIFKESVEELSTLFMDLSTRMYPNLSHMLVEKAVSSNVALYNFSRFFRKAPILINQMSKEELLKLLKNPENYKISETIKPISPELHDLLRQNYIVTNQQQTETLDIKAKKFIEIYNQIINKLGSKNVVQRAWAVNQDRAYFDGKSLGQIAWNIEKLIVDEKISANKTQRIIKSLIESNDRTNAISSQGKIISDRRIFWNGHSEVQLNSNGSFKVRVIVYQENNSSIPKKDFLHKLPDLDRDAMLNFKGGSFKVRQQVAAENGDLIFESEDYLMSILLNFDFSGDLEISSKTGVRHFLKDIFTTP